MKELFDTKEKSPVIIDMTRDNLGQLFKDFGFKVGAEIGVEQGLFSRSLCKGNPHMKLYGVDAWQAYKGYRDHVSQLKLDGFYNKTLQRMQPYNFTAIKGFSLDIVNEFDDNSLDFVYIDANHDFQNVTNDIVEWSKKVRSGGIISGHDYRRTKGGAINDTVDVVNAYVYAKGLKLFILKGDRASSWLWIKP